MRSIKPGRGPSMMGGVMGIFVAIFGVFWTILALTMGAPIFFPLFGVVFVIMAIVQTVFHFKNATGKNRYSAFDITEHGEEPDPLDLRYGGEEPYSGSAPSAGNSLFCPYCGAAAEPDHLYCSRCGKKLP